MRLASKPDIQATLVIIYLCGFVGFLKLVMKQISAKKSPADPNAKDPSRNDPIAPAEDKTKGGNE